jgi:hypothetical protein
MCACRRLAACAFVCLATVDAASAQTTHGYAGAALTVAPWRVQSVSGGSPSTTYSNQSADIRVTDVTVEGAWYFAPHAALGVEVSPPRERHEIRQEFRYFSPTLRFSRYRETLVLVVVRHDFRLVDRAGIALVGGGGFAHGTSRDRYARGQFDMPDYGLVGPATEVSGTSLAWTVGTDLMVTVVPHVELVPRFRLLFVDHGGPPDDPGPFGTLGLPSPVWNFGIGIRATF